MARKSAPSVDTPIAIQDAFNDAVAVPRLIALVSPTCETCLSGARGVAALLDGDHQSALRVLMVWMQGEPADSVHEANRQAELHRDGRLMHFWDGGDLVGAIVAELLGHAGLIAWDIYLGYQAETRWDDTLPVPAAWMHQMGDPSWSHDNHGCDANTFPDRLRAVVDAIQA